MNEQIPKFNTPGRMAELLNVPVHRVLYILKTRNIEPKALAGRVRLYDMKALARLRYELNCIDARESARCGDGN